MNSIPSSALSPRFSAPSESLPLESPPENKDARFSKIAKQLYEAYDPSVVEDVLMQVQQRYNPEALPEREVERLNLFCHYYDLENKANALQEGCSSEIARLMRRYVRHSQGYITSVLSQEQDMGGITHEHLEQAHQNYLEFVSYLPELIEKYDEWVCHRALRHYTIVSDDVLCGKQKILPKETFFERVADIFDAEADIRRLIEKMPASAVCENYNLFCRRILKLQDPQSKNDLKLELDLKTGNVRHYQPLVSAQAIKEYSSLFEASIDGTRWAKNKEKLTPLDSEIQNNINDVYMLGSSRSPESNETVAVFKAQTAHKYAGAMEALAYDTCLIFGLSEGVVPTKQKDLCDMSGSIQIFQEGLSWNQFNELSSEEKDNIVEKITLKNFLQAAIASILIGNRDVHMNNFFFVEKENGEYGIVVFDNELSFMESNQVLTTYSGASFAGDSQSIEKSSATSANPPSYQRESLLPLRGGLLILPQAHQPISGQDKEWLKSIVNTWPKKFGNFMNYLHSPAGLQKLSKLHHKRLTQYQIQAMQERIETIIEYVNRDKDYSFFDLLRRIYPLFSDFYNLTSLVYPIRPEFWVGARSAEYLCKKALKKDLISEEIAQKFLKRVYSHAQRV